jgi:hypothetical protein
MKEPSSFFDAGEVELDEQASMEVKRHCVHEPENRPFL